MKKIIETLDKEKNIKRVTCVDERWYIKDSTNKETGLPEYLYVPSVTWISSYYPKGIGFYKFLAQKGWDEAEAIKQAAGDKGSKVHYAIEDLIAGKIVTMESKYLNPTTEQEEALTLEEYECLISFAGWVKERNPKFLKSEFVVFEEAFGYAGTVDTLCEIDGELFIVDFKTSQSVWPDHELQISAYKQALDLKELGIEGKEVNMMILQLGYRRNKKLWKENIIEDKFILFLAAREIWKNECGTDKPSQKDYPLSLQIVPKAEEPKAKLKVKKVKP
jgi:hypothetical protein